MTPAMALLAKEEEWCHLPFVYFFCKVHQAMMRVEFSGTAYPRSNNPSSNRNFKISLRHFHITSLHIRSMTALRPVLIICQHECEKTNLAQEKEV